MNEYQNMGLYELNEYYLKQLLPACNRVLASSTSTRNECETWRNRTNDCRSELMKRKRGQHRAAMEDALREEGLKIGDYVECFALGFGGFFSDRITGKITKGKATIRVRFDSPFNGKKSCEWHRGWKKIKR